MKDGGLAGRFDVLLRQWTKLESLNQQAIDRWEERLNVPHYERTHQPTIRQQVDVTVNHYGISPEIFAKYAADLGVTDAALTNFFKILEQNKVDRLDLDKKLREIAVNYQKSLENAKLLEGSDDPEVNTLLQQAREWIEGKKDAQDNVTIDFSKAEILLQQALQQEEQSIERLQKIEEKAKIAREKKQSSAAHIKRQLKKQKEIQRNKEKASRLSVEIIYQRAIIASIQFNNAKAIHHYRQLYSLPYITDFPHLDQLVSDYAASINLQKGYITSLYIPENITMSNQNLTKIFDNHLGTTGGLNAKPSAHSFANAR